MKLRVTVAGVSYDVDVEVLDAGAITAPPLGAPVVSSPVVSSPARASHAAAPKGKPAAVMPPPTPVAPLGAGEKVCKSPIAGTVTQVKVKPGDVVAVNQVVVVLEAMKMETNISSPVAGTVKSVTVKAGEAVKHGQVLVELE